MTPATKRLVQMMANGESKSIKSYFNYQRSLSDWKTGHNLASFFERTGCGRGKNVAFRGRQEREAKTNSADCFFEYEQELFATGRVPGKFLPGQGRVQKFAVAGHFLMIREVQIAESH